MREVAVVTTGFFDGVHRGHRHVLETVVSSARVRGEEAIVLTFWPHPRTVLQQDARELRLLTSLEEKKTLLAAAGVDRVEFLPFTRAFAALTATEYLAKMRADYGASVVVMGYDNRIGSDHRTAAELDGVVCCAEAEPALHISSTHIRRALSEGDIDRANAMLGYPYPLLGAVVAGNRVGRTLGFPTANMCLYEPLKAVPGNGVYAVEAEVQGKTFRGMCNIGLRPTVGGSARSIETHILDFDQDIYGLPLRIRFLRRLREERKFPSMDALRAQLEKDAAVVARM